MSLACLVVRGVQFSPLLLLDEEKSLSVNIPLVHGGSIFGSLWQMESFLLS